MAGAPTPTRAEQSSERASTGFGRLALLDEVTVYDSLMCSLLPHEKSESSLAWH